MIKLYISNDIQIHGMEELHTTHVKKTLTLQNPMWFKLQRMGNTRALYSCPKEFKYYTENGGTFSIPRGMRSRLIKFLEVMKLEYEIKEDQVNISVWETAPKLEGELRDHQRGAVDKIIREQIREGVIVMGTGSGKSIAAIELFTRLNATTTILVPNTALLSQWQAELKKFYGIEAGLLYGKEKNIQPITVATFQSLYEYTDLVKKLVDQTSILFVDECHGAVSKENRKVVSRFRPTYIFGTTATVNREDKQSAAINFFFGDTVFEHHETQATPSIEYVRTGVFIPVDDYPRMIDNMVENESRNTLIKGLVIGEVYSGRKVLVLSKRIAHANTLFQTFKGDGGVYLIDSSDKGRNALLAEFKQNKRPFNLIFGTTALLSVGVDIPALDTLILACDIKAETLLIQSSGRILRLFEGKADPKIIDLCDDKNPILLRQFYARKKVYQQKGWSIAGEEKK